MKGKIALDFRFIVFVTVVIVILVFAILTNGKRPNVTQFKTPTPGQSEQLLGKVSLPTLAAVKKDCGCCKGIKVPANTIVFVGAYGQDGKINPDGFVQLGLIGPGDIKSTGEEVVSNNGTHYCNTTLKNAWFVPPIPKN